MLASEKMAEVFDLSVEVIRKALNSGNDKVSPKARVALSSMGIFSRLKSQENSRLSLQYRVMKDLSKDKAELAQYVKATLPEMKVKKLKG